MLSTRRNRHWIRIELKDSKEQTVIEHRRVGVYGCSVECLHAYLVCNTLLMASQTVETVVNIDYVEDQIQVPIFRRNDAPNMKFYEDFMMARHTQQAVTLQDSYRVMLQWLEECSETVLESVSKMPWLELRQPSRIYTKSAKPYRKVVGGKSLHYMADALTSATPDYKVPIDDEKLVQDLDTAYLLLDRCETTYQDLRKLLKEEDQLMTAINLAKEQLNKTKEEIVERERQHAQIKKQIARHMQKGDDPAVYNKY
jgi:hypothetical protein